MKFCANSLRDRQTELPAACCCRCGGEQYRWDAVYLQDGKIICEVCMREERGGAEGHMTLRELSVEYRAQAETLKTRVLLLAVWRKTTQDPKEKNRLEERIRALTAMWREARDLAVLTERYYERGYRRNGKYTL